MHLWNFGEKTKGGDATTQHWFSNTYIKFFERTCGKAEKPDATRQHWFSHIHILPPKRWVSFLYRSLFSRNYATQILKRTYEIFWEKDKKGLCNNATLIFERIYEIFEKSWEKAEKGWCNNATLTFTHPHSTIKKVEYPSYTGIFSHATMQQRSWNAHIKFWEEKIKRGDATMQHCFLNAYMNFLKKLRKGWKGWRNNATLIFTHPHSTTKKAEFPSYT